MDVSISNLLKLDVFTNARLITGQAGIHNVIHDISVLEMPIIEFDESIETTIGAFYLTGLYAYKEDEAGLVSLFKQLVAEKCSGVCIIDTYFKDLPDQIVTLCIEHQIPIIMMPDAVPYALILNAIYNEVIRMKDAQYTETLLETLMSEDLYPEEVRQRAERINSNFLSQHFAIFVQGVGQVHQGTLSKIQSDDIVTKNWCVARFRSGILIIATFENKQMMNYGKSKEKVVSLLKGMFANYRIGISNLNSNLSTLDESIKEALVANHACMSIGGDVTEYANIGVYKLLFQLKGDRRLAKFRDEVLQPIKAYEVQHNISLLETAKAFIENDGDIKKTAAVLYLHINTVRYRMEKIKKIMGMDGTNLKYIEQLSIAIKADNVLNNLK